jgi:hypothetical protein
MQHHTGLDKCLLHLLPNPGVVAREWQLARKEEMHGPPRLPLRKIPRRTHTARPCSNDGERYSVGHILTHFMQARPTVVDGLDGAVAPESVRNPGSNDKIVISHLFEAAITRLDPYVLCPDIDRDDPPLKLLHVVEATISVERREVVLFPTRWSSKPEAELLAADQRGLRGNTDDIEVISETDGRENTGITEPGD